MGPYDDIIHLPHHVSDRRPQMSMSERAAQFSPFAALTGYDAVIKETGRIRDTRIEMDEEELQRLNRMLRMLLENPGASPEITVVYFKQDERGDQGTYKKETGFVKKVDEFRRIIVMCSGTVISIDDVIDLEGELFSSLD